MKVLLILSMVTIRVGCWVVFSSWFVYYIGRYGWIICGQFEYEGMWGGTERTKEEEVMITSNDWLATDREWMWS